MRQYYQNRIQEEQNILKEIKAKYNRISNLRLLAILLFAILAYFVIQTTLWLALPFLLLSILGFYFLVKHHDRLENNQKLKAIELEVLQNEINILDDKANLYHAGERYWNEKHAFSYDLDLFGQGSVFHLINRAKTTQGQDRLADALLARPEDLAIAQKQEAAKELLKEDRWRQEFQSTLYDIEDDNVAELGTLESPPNIPFEKFVLAYQFLKWGIGPLLFAAFYFWGIENGLLTFVALLAFHFMLSGSQNKKTRPYYAKLKGTSRTIGHYAQALDKILAKEWQSENLKALKSKLIQLQAKGQNPVYEFQTMAKRIEMKENKMAQPFLYLFSPFDLLELAKLRIWHAARPDFFAVLFEVVGEFEKYSSAATLAFNCPAWTFPIVGEQENVFLKAKALGHPLVKGSITNDFEINQNNRLSLITGSNMSGKSTFLRTIGTQIQMAYAGMPVFAESLEISTEIRLYTYMRIKDSLQENASTFKAEIDRIKMLLDAMFSQTKVLVLVDEMLRGTNSEDKLKGSIAFLEKVIESKAFALVATHDLRTTEMAQKYASEVENYYFEYDTQNGELAFDYKLKPGVCKSFNASALLRNIGLNV
ncbi:hypothetical protein LAG90_12905 [Marinilongibacter aquaticus]|uniref:MutS-related protein n=1 Tax=Marinilongibacter aquaticus TaxID=2975157 RepID=UPI0021BD017F|nr:hypothetical protein [Marinilongibacter aquaticus]UBM57712.1 hypothetical protein LAG90_12905 [Marinilongibacter aquaticus]